MNPSNPSNGNPLVYDVQDAQGVKHQVVPVNHTHTKSEVTNFPNIDQTPNVNNHGNLISSSGVAYAIQNADFVSNSPLTITAQQEYTTNKILHGDDNIFYNVKEGGLAIATFRIVSYNGTELGKTNVIVSWDNSVSGVYKFIRIYTNDAIYNFRKTVADDTWRELTKEASSIASILPA